LSVLGAAAGLLFAQWGARILVNLLSTARNPVDIDLSLDLTVLAFTTAVAMVTGLLFGLAPALAATRVSARHALSENARGAVHGSSRFHLSKALVAAQVALSLTLLIGAGLFIATMRNLLNAPLGFDRHNVILAHVNTQSRVPHSQRIELYSDILEGLRSIPGVAAASTSYLTPITDAGWAMRCYPEGFLPASPRDNLVFLNRVSPAYFQTMDTALLMGRDFSPHDSLTSRKVLIINESAARRFFPGNPVGRTIEFDVIGRRGVREAYEVIGVVRDAKYNDIREKTRLMAYFAVAQDADPASTINLEVRISGKVPDVLPNIRSAIAAVDAGLSVEFRSLETQVADSLTQERTMALLSSFFGALALLLATIGLYGVTSYTVLRRRSEIGVRMALGATRASVIWLVLRDVVILLFAGTVAGLIAATAAGRLAANLLYGLEPTDLRTTVLAIAILAIATLIAGYLPASRASRLDPSSTLRD
jgi:predicted permease